ncbi:hypothetical protein [Dactylosporangium sp. CS-033363]|uniref:hypothetical protein n=1 Tax=Dactylosporangium sp. CS-033363 TaxID=3239935 RepID=UPI003D8DCBBA
MSSAASKLVALAILQVNSDTNRTTYMDNFVPFVSHALAGLGGHADGYAPLSTAIRQQFGLHVPEGAIRSIVDRMRRKNMVVGTAESIDFVGGPPNGLDKATSEFERKERVFLRTFREYAAQRTITVTDEQATAALLRFVETHGVNILRERIGTAHPDPGQEVVPADPEPVPDGDAADVLDDELVEPEPPEPAADELDVALALFIRQLIDDDDPLAEHVIAWVQGMMLSSSLYQGDEVIKPFENATVYLDTRVLFRALGLSGEEFKNATLPTLELAKSAKAKLGCFAHTIEEMQDILYAIAMTMRSARRAEQIQEVERYIFSRPELTDRDVFRLSDELPDLVTALGVEVVDKPTYEEYQYQTDEDDFRTVIRQTIGPKMRETAVDRDIDSITSVYRLRRGATMRSLERCAALFVTTSSGLVRAARLHFGTKHREVPLAMVESRFQTTVWLKNPIKVDASFPRAQVIAHCYAALQPTEFLWSAYLSKIDEFTRQRKNPEADFIYLRYSESARDALMDLTLGNPDLLTQESLMRILDNRDDAILEPLRAKIVELEEQAARLTLLLSDVDSARFNAEQTSKGHQDQIEALTDEILKLKSKQRAAARHANRVAKTAPPAGKNKPAAAVKAEAAEPAPVVPAPVPVQTDSKRIDALIEMMVAGKVRGRMAWIVAVGTLVLAATVVVVAKPDAKYLDFMPGWVKWVFIGVGGALSLLSLLTGWSLKHTTGYLRKRIEKRVRRQMPE